MNRPDNDLYSDEQMERKIYAGLIAALVILVVLLVGTWAELVRL